MLINKLPAIQLSSNLNMALAVLRNVLKQQQQQQQVPLPNVDLFSCCPSVCVCVPRSAFDMHMHGMSLLLPEPLSFPLASLQHFSSHIQSSVVIGRTCCLEANYQTNGQAESLPSPAERSGSKGISSEREKEIKTLNGLTIKYAAKRVTIWRSYRPERLPINLILLRI